MKPIAKAFTAGLAALTLTGCISLFPKQEPARLYRFGSVPAQAGAHAPGSVNVAVAPVDFNAAAAGDRLLTVTGSEVAYIASARWATPARIQFADALAAAFDGASNVSIAGRRELRSASALLEVNVTSFEVRYLQGQGAAPTAVVGLNATLVKLPERTIIARRTFVQQQPASENRVSAIVAALDGANSAALGELVAWTDQNAR
ncbi:MAG: ABC-type transport auxiliary lipoprotein family protein [Caulobacteraceae bacterium]|nr:ABC-type transport auxiliary lipoprotein family protein [Caulobacteraceae bacterium]